MEKLYQGDAHVKRFTLSSSSCERWIRRVCSCGQVTGGRVRTCESSLLSLNEKEAGKIWGRGIKF